VSLSIRPLRRGDAAARDQMAASERRAMDSTGGLARFTPWLKRRRG
jgi:hypothetical protein